MFLGVGGVEIHVGDGGRNRVLPGLAQIRPPATPYAALLKSGAGCEGTERPLPFLSMTSIYDLRGGETGVPAVAWRDSLIPCPVLKELEWLQDGNWS